jgi:hypothetical protein
VRSRPARAPAVADARRAELVAEARAAVLAAGGSVIGDVVTLGTADGRFVTWTYLTDPEGNILELQSWSESEPEITG